MLILRNLRGHKNVATTERYAHLTDDPVKRAADNASGDIASALGEYVMAGCASCAIASYEDAISSRSLTLKSFNIPSALSDAGH
jgi:hypothetical protein